MKLPDDVKSASLDVFDARANSAEEDKQDGGKDEPQDPPLDSQDLPDVTYGTSKDKPQLDDASPDKVIRFGTDPGYPELVDASGGEEITVILDDTAEDGAASDGQFANIFVAVDPPLDFGEIQRAGDDPVLNYPLDDEDEDDGEG